MVKKLGILNEEGKGWKIDPEYAIKHIKQLVFGFVAVAIVVGIAIQVNLNNTNDLLNATTLSAEIIFGIFISLVVYIYSKRQHDLNKKQQENIELLIKESTKGQGEINKLVNEIKGLENNQQKLIHFQEQFMKRYSMYYSNAVLSNLLSIQWLLVNEQIQILKLYVKKPSKKKILKILQETDEKAIERFETIRLVSHLSNHSIDPSIILNFPSFVKNYEGRKDIVDYKLEEIEKLYHILEKRLDMFIKFMPGRLKPTILPSEINETLKDFI